MGLVLGVVLAVVKTLQALRDGKELAAPPRGRWEPAAAPLSNAVVAGSAELDVDQVQSDVIDAGAPDTPETESSAPETPKTDGPGARQARAWVEPTGAVCPNTHPVKAKMASGLFHLPGMLNYVRTRPDRCYASEEAARADGLAKSKR
jgi:hypothetical protein